MNKFLLCLVLGTGLFFSNSIQAHDHEKPATVHNGALQLVANRGQITDQYGNLRPDIDARAEQHGVVVFVGDGQLHYQWTKTTSPQPSPKERGINSNSDNTVTSPLERPGEVSIYRMDVTLVGADRTVQPVFEEATGYYENYYLAHTGEHGVQAQGYNRVVYRDVYPGIDWVIYVNPNDKIPNTKGGNTVTSPSERPGEAVLKYDFIIHPGGNPADIRLRYDGATGLRLEDDALVAETPYGSITEDAPYSYMQDGGAVVASKYILEGNELRFDVDSYSGTLVIDPKLGWATYYGGNSSDLPQGCNTDTAGNLYVAGSSQSTNNIATPTTSPHQVTMAGVQDGFVVKFNPAGVIQWGTYFGGTLLERLCDVVADSFGNVYSCGYSGSTGLATPGAYQDTFGGQADGILLKLRATNGTRLWSTYFGGTGTEDMLRIDCDDLGNVYTAGGMLGSPGMLTGGMSTPGAFLSTPGWSTMVSFNSAGQRRWCTYYYSRIYDIHYSRKNNLLYICGPTDTTTGHSTAGTHQQSLNGTSDGFLACFNTSGARQWGTYYGGPGGIGEGLIAVTTDRAGYIYAGGHATSTTGIATPNAHQATMTAAAGMLVKFTQGGQRIWGTYYGRGGGGTSINGVATDSFGMVYFAGGTSAPDGIATPGAPQTTPAGQDDIFTACMDSSGKRLWGTYYGGTQNDVSQITMTYGKERVYVATTTRSSGLATGGAHQSNFIGNLDDCLFVQWNVADTIVFIKELFTDTFACNGDTIKINYGVNKPFNSNNTFTVQLSNSSGSFASPVNIGSKSGTKADSIACIIPNGLADGNGYKVRVVASSPRDTTFANTLPIRIANYPANFTAGVNKPSLCTADTLRLSSSSTTAGVSYSWTGPNSFTANTANAAINNPTVAATGNYIIEVGNKGCATKDTLQVTVTQTPENVTAGSNSTLCTGDTLKLNATSTTGGVSYNWQPGNYGTAAVMIPNVPKNMAGVYTVTARLGNCTATATTNVVIDQAAVVNAVPMSGIAICTGTVAQFSGFVTHAGSNPLYNWQLNGVDIPGANTVNYQSSSLVTGDKIRLRVTPNSTCPGDRYSNELTMAVLPPKTPKVSINADIMPPWNRNQVITFKATVSDANGHAGAPPAYQWRKNGQNIGGAISDYWGVNTASLNENDVICLFINSAYECSNPDTLTSNCITSKMTGVSGQELLSGIKVYPNPVTHLLYIDGLAAGSRVELYDIVGRKCTMAQYLNGSMDFSMLPAGNYILQVVGEDGERGYYKVTKE